MVGWPWRESSTSGALLFLRFCYFRLIHREGSGINEPVVRLWAWLVQGALPGEGCFSRLVPVALAFRAWRVGGLVFLLRVEWERAFPNSQASLRIRPAYSRNCDQYQIAPGNSLRTLNAWCGIGVCRVGP